jgi:peptidoglycan/xylan/chitin deacetylase (PgdA/CDA1 family)
MGAGAIFMIQRVRPHEESLTPGGTIAETDPRLLEEMVSLIAAQKLEAVSLDEMRRRLVEQDLESRFVCFTFDGAYRSVKDLVYPLFLKRGIPFAIYAATDYLDGSALPWWLALEVLVKESDKVTEFASMDSAKSARMVPGAASFGLVAPITSRFLATAFSPSRTCTTTGPEVMKVQRSLKKGRSLWTA